MEKIYNHTAQYDLLSNSQPGINYPGTHIGAKTTENKNGRKDDIKIKKEEDILNTASAVTSNYRGADGALYTLEIFMRDKRTCRWVILTMEH